MHPIKRWTAGAIAFSLLASSSISVSKAQAEAVSASESQAVSLTIYNQNFGLVRDVRVVELSEGLNHLQFEDVAAQIDPTTVSFTSITAPNAVTVREQNYRYDLINPETILSKSIGKNLKFRRILPTGQVEELSGTLLNAPKATIADTAGNISVQSQGLVIKTGNGILLNPQGEVELAELPAGLVSKPSLLWKLEASKAGKHKTEIAYQTGGLNWHCDYVAIANADDSQTDLTSWVTLDNKSGASYKNAALKLLAGDVHRVTTDGLRRHAYAKMQMVAEAAAAPQFTEKAFAEYHLYTLQGKTDVNHNETKQLTLFSADKVPTKKLFIYEPEAARYIWGDWVPPTADAQKINVKLEVENKQANHLGMPLPKGKLRVYKRDDDGALQFIGEDLIDHTPRDEKIRIYIGNAFDLVGERKQTNVQRVSDRMQRMSYEISLRNHKDSEVTITAVEHCMGQWKILNSSHPYSKKDSKTFEFAIKVPANGEVKVSYEIEMKY
jgi:hypothetical protein